eukprot:Lankesteria_metandrocarpae@DN8583_c0_g1_i1.p1
MRGFCRLTCCWALQGDASVRMHYHGLQVVMRCVKSSVFFFEWLCTCRQLRLSRAVSCAFSCTTTVVLHCYYATVAIGQLPHTIVHRNWSVSLCLCVCKCSTVMYLRGELCCTLRIVYFVLYSHCTRHSV